MRIKLPHLVDNDALVHFFIGRKTIAEKNPDTSEFTYSVEEVTYDIVPDKLGKPVKVPTSFRIVITEKKTSRALRFLLPSSGDTHWIDDIELVGFTETLTEKGAENIAMAIASQLYEEFAARK